MHFQITNFFAHTNLYLFLKINAESCRASEMRASRHNRGDSPPILIRPRCFSFALSAPLHRASLSPVLRAVLSFFHDISVPRSSPYPTTLADASSRRNARFVLNFLDHTFRTIARELFARLVMRKSLHSIALLCTIAAEFRRRRETTGFEHEPH